MRIRSSRLAAASLIAGAISLAPASARALEVFACEPEWAALVRQIAPDAAITVATHAYQDPHHIEARPALISGLRRADLAVCTGASLEAGWLPMLQQRSGNAAVQVGRPGMFFAAETVSLIDPLARVDRSMGDMHAEGNPHLHLDPVRLTTIARRLAERMGLIDPRNAAAYRERQQGWERSWNARVAQWQAKAAPLAGKAVVAEHSGFAYLWRWLGIRQTADLEPKPGIPPTPSHLQDVLGRVAAEPPFAVVQSLHQDPQAGRWIVARIQRPLLVLPATVTPKGPTADLDGLFEHLIDALLEAERTTAGQ
ncbi:MAG: metal ABC transporter solute-binding protein, Zn/Mn family [Lautropia sp.]